MHGSGVVEGRGNAPEWPGRLCACLCIVAASIGLASCNRDRSIVLDTLLTVEETGYDGSEISEKTLAELKEAIRVLEDVVNRTVDAGEKLGVYYKLVALRFMDQDMFGLAAEYFEKALGIYPANQYLAYMCGVCTASLARSKVDGVDRDELLTRAESYYQYAIQLKGTYVEAMYALSILYVFELSRQLDAQPLLERILTLEEMNFNAMFLLARVYVAYGRLDDALVLYDRIASKSPDKEAQSRAAANKRELLGGTGE